MPDLHIGGFHFCIQSDLPLASLPPGSPYRAFAAADSGLDDIPVEVYLEPLDFSRMAPMEVLFDGPTWSMHSDGSLRRIVMHDRENPEPFWLAEFAAGGRRVRIFCGKRQMNDRGEINSPLSYPLDQLLLMYLLSETGGVLLHAAGGVKNGGMVFAGPSGAGKTTMTRMLLAEGCEMFSDDRVIVRPHGGNYALFGTPWPGDAGVAANRHAPLRQVCILQKADTDRLEPLDPAAALERIIPCCSLPWFDAPVLAQALGGLNRLLQQVPQSVCHFTKKTPEP